MRLTVDYLLVHGGEAKRLGELLRESLRSTLEENDLPAEDNGSRGPAVKILPACA